MRNPIAVLGGRAGDAMRKTLALLGVTLVLVGGAWVAPAQAPAPVLRLGERLKRAGRAEATLTRTVPDPFSGRAAVTRGAIALEPPDRLSLSLPASGERLTLRSDGGEWLQPRLEQMLVLPEERAAAARRWWKVLLGEEDESLRFRRIDARRILVMASSSAEAAPESAWVQLDGRGLPARLEVDEGAGAPTVYRFSGWRFSKPRGRAAFTQQAPSGFEVVPMP